MPTTIHLPDELLEQLDKQAAAHHMSRNRYIVRALKRQLEEETEWSEPFLDMVRESLEDKDRYRTVDEMLNIIHSSRKSKPDPPDLG